MPDSVTGRRQTWSAAALVAGVAFAIYALSGARDITLAHYGFDGGELITATVTGGIPHPTGYPLYVWLNRWLAWVPVSPVAYRFNLFSALTTALAAGVVAATSCRQPLTRRRRLGAIAAGLTVAFTPSIWQQATIAEVYGLNLLCVSALLWSLENTRDRAVAGWLWGISITTHLTSLLLFPLIARHVWRGVPGDGWRCAGGVTLGLLPTLALPWLASPEAPVSWGNPETFTGWWAIVSGAQYRANVLAVHPLSRLGPMASFMGAQFAWVGWIALAWALRHRSTWLEATVSLVFIGYAMTYAAVDYTVFALPALLLLGRALPLAFEQRPGVALVLPFLLIALNFVPIARTNAYTVRQAILPTLSTAPEDAVVITPGDGTTGILWYLQHVEGVRADVCLVDYNLFQFDWYRANVAITCPDIFVPATDDLAALQRVNQSERSVCTFDFARGTATLTCGRKGASESH